MRRILDFLSFILLIQSSGAIVHLIVTGGAHDQGIDDSISFTGSIIAYLTIFWKVSVVLIFCYIFITTKLRYFDFQSTWLALIALCLSSLFWAEYFKADFESTLWLILIYVFINLHIRFCGWNKVLDLLNKIFIIILVLSLISIFLLPGYGIAVGEHAGKWQGVFPHKNILGNFAAMAYVFFIWYSTIKSTKWTIIWTCLAVLLTIGSECTTGIMNIAVSTLIFLAFRLPSTSRLLFKNRYSFVFLFITTFVLMIIISLDDNQITIGDKDTTFSDRNRVWDYILSKIQSAPWFGHGLGQIGANVLANEEEFLSQVGFVVGTAHNGFLETLHDLGVVGLILLITLLISPLSFKRNRPEFELYFLYLLFFILLNMFESKMIELNVFFVMFMYVSKITEVMSIQHSLQRPVDQYNSKKI